MGEVNNLRRVLNFAEISTEPRNYIVSMECGQLTCESVDNSNLIFMKLLLRIVLIPNAEFKSNIQRFLNSPVHSNGHL